MTIKITCVIISLFEFYFIVKHLSRFMAKTLRVNKAVIKKFLKNQSFRVDVKLQVPPLTYKITAPNMSYVRS